MTSPSQSPATNPSCSAGVNSSPFAAITSEPQRSRIPLARARAVRLSQRLERPRIFAKPLVNATRSDGTSPRASSTGTYTPSPTTPITSSWSSHFASPITACAASIASAHAAAGTTSRTYDASHGKIPTNRCTSTSRSQFEHAIVIACAAAAPSIPNFGTNRNDNAMSSAADST